MTTFINRSEHVSKSTYGSKIPFTPKVKVADFARRQCFEAYYIDSQPLIEEKSLIFMMWVGLTKYISR